MEVTKRTYQKHKTEKKITVKHYLITNIKNDDELGDPTYPIYVQVTYKRKNTKFKSKVPCTYLSELPVMPVFDSLSSYEEYYFENIKNDFDCALTRDLNFINWLVEQQISQRGEQFDISELPKLYHSESFELSKFIESSLKKEIQKTLCDITGFNESNKFIIFSRFPVSHNSSSLINLEFYLHKYPELISLKTEYSSHLWLYSMYEELGDSSNGVHRDPMFSITDQYDGHVISFPPTIFDYLTNIFQKRLSDNFQDLKVVNHIISDINILFSKYYDEYISSIRMNYYLS
jgi:hypothetical protein